MEARWKELQMFAWSHFLRSTGVHLSGKCSGVPNRHTIYDVLSMHLRARRHCPDTCIPPRVASRIPSSGRAVSWISAAISSVSTGSQNSRRVCSTTHPASISTRPSRRRSPPSRYRACCTTPPASTSIPPFTTLRTAKGTLAAIDGLLILLADHELNASTFAARVAASTLTDLHAAVTAAIGALKGPLHGGANEAVASMFLQIQSPDRAEPWINAALASKQRVMGFGHRVLKQGDSRSLIVQRQAEALSRACGDRRWFDIATIVDRTMQREKGLYPNLDFYTAVAYLLMGIPRDLYTPLFVCARITGWCAHIIEQQDNNRLIRPRALYTGPPPQPYVPIAQRA